MKGRAVLALALALGLLGLFILAVGWDEVLGAARTASVPLFAVAFLGTVVTLGLRSLVWHQLLSSVDEQRPYWLFTSVFLGGTFVKYVTPYGQVASGVGVAALVSRYYESTYEESLAAILSADFLNYLPYYTFGTIGLGWFLLFDTLPVTLSEYVLPASLVVSGALLLLFVLYYKRAQTGQVLLRAVYHLRRLLMRIHQPTGSLLTRENIITKFKGFAVTLELLSKDRPTMVRAIVTAHIAWLGFVLALYASALAVGVSLPISVILLSIALSKLGFLMPTPGGVGGVEIALASVLFLLSPMGSVLATTVAILYRVATYWFTVLLGGTSSIALTIFDPTPP